MRIRSARRGKRAAEKRRPLLRQPRPWSERRFPERGRGIDQASGSGEREAVRHAALAIVKTGEPVSTEREARKRNGAEQENRHRQGAPAQRGGQDILGELFRADPQRGRRGKLRISS